MTNETLNCSQTLRAIGQLLEALNIESFTLRVDDNDFLIRERVPRRNREIKIRESLASAWKVIQARDSDFKNSFHSTGVLEFRVTQEDVAVVEREGQTRRQNSSKAPETGAPSQILRAIGGYVDQKRDDCSKFRNMIKMSTLNTSCLLAKPLSSNSRFLRCMTTG